MPDPAYLRLKARQCRELAEVATMPEVQEQLALFADEFNAHAEALARIGVAAMRMGMPNADAR